MGDNSPDHILKNKASREASKESQVGTRQAHPVGQNVLDTGLAGAQLIPKQLRISQQDSQRRV